MVLWPRKRIKMRSNFVRFVPCTMGVRTYMYGIYESAYAKISHHYIYGTYGTAYYYGSIFLDSEQKD